MVDEHKEEKHETLSLLGSGKTNYPQHPDEAKLEVFENQWPGHSYTVELHCPEFTTVCPITAQPDFAKIYIRYIPDEYLVESKALKLYLFSFRNIGMFHEFVVNKIAKDLFDAMRPKEILVRGEFNPRGGIAIHPEVILKKE